jgi:outer membrane protein with glycine zipper
MLLGRLSFVPALVVLTALVAGCQSPYYADRGAMAGGVTGAGVGALVGEASGHPGAGALVGAGVGALTGGLIGSGMDDVDARNQARFAAAAAASQPPPGAVTVNEVMTMSRSGVDEELIANHVRANGVARPLQANELIMLQQQGVSKRVIEALQTTPARMAPMIAQPPPMMVPPYYYPPPPPPYWGYGYGPAIGVGFYGR